MIIRNWYDQQTLLESQTYYFLIWFKLFYLTITNILFQDPNGNRINEVLLYITIALVTFTAKTFFELKNTTATKKNMKRDNETKRLKLRKNESRTWKTVANFFKMHQTYGSIATLWKLKLVVLPRRAVFPLQFQDKRYIRSFRVSHRRPPPVWQPQSVTGAVLWWRHDAVSPCHCQNRSWTSVFCEAHLWRFHPDCPARPAGHGQKRQLWDKEIYRTCKGS